MDPTTFLPAEVSHIIFSHLPPSELFTLRTVSKSWNHHLSCTYLQTIVNRSLPFASTAKTLLERLQRRKNFQAGTPKIYEIAADGHDDGSKAHTFVGSKQVIFSAGYLGVVRNWDTMKVHDGDKHDPATLEIWNLAAGGCTSSDESNNANDKPVVVLDLPGLFSVENGKFSAGHVWLFGEVDKAVIRVDRTDEESADEFFRGFAVLDLKSGSIISKWYYPLDSPQAELHAPDQVQCNGTEVLAVWKELYDDNEFISVHDVATGDCLRWEEVHESDASGLISSALDPSGTAYIIATDGTHDHLNLRTFSARSDPATSPTRSIPLHTVFNIPSHHSLRNPSLELVDRTLYFKATYTADPKARWSTREKAHYSTLLTALPTNLFSPARALPASFPSPTVISRVESCYHDLTFIHDKMSIWGYSTPAFSSNTPQAMRLAHLHHPSGTSTPTEQDPLAHQTIDSITTHKNSKITSGDDQALVFYPRGPRPRRESYSHPDGERHPALLLDFGGELRVPEGLAREVQAENFVEMCKPLEEEEESEEHEHGESAEAEAQAEGEAMEQDEDGEAMEVDE